MNTTGRHAQDNIAILDILSVDDLIALHGADGKSGKVVIPRRIKAWHFGSLAANQSAPRLSAAFRDACDYRLGDVVDQLPGRKVIKKKQRLRALNDNVVDAHGNTIDSDRVMDACIYGDFNLCADSICRRDENRVLESRILEVEQGTESADAGDHAAAVGFTDMRLDPLNQLVRDVNINTGLFVCAFFHFASLVWDRYNRLSTRNQDVRWP